MYEYQLGLYEKAFPDDLPLEEKLLLSKELGYDFMEFCVDLNPQRAARLEGCPVRMAWAQELEGASLRLTTPDRLLLDQLGSVLGRYDAASQVQALAEGAARLEEQRRAAQDSRQRLGRVYTALGLAGGALMMILLI